MRDGEELGSVERHGNGENRRDGEADCGGESGGEEELGVDGGNCAEFSGALVGGGEEVVGGEQHRKEGAEGEGEGGGRREGERGGGGSGGGEG